MTIDYAVFILTHRRPDRVLTYKTLRRQGYTGNIYLVVDDEDPTLPQYINRYGDQVVTFSKSQAAEYTDDIDLYGQRSSVVYARNFCWQLAEQLGIEYFLELDDDYNRFVNTFSADYKPVIANLDHYITSLDDLFALVFEYLANTPITCIALSQGGDLIGGPHKGTYTKTVGTKRKAMNSFFCCTRRPFSFIGILNDDVNTYVVNSYRGGLFITLMQVHLDQVFTQQYRGGLTDLYLESGTYVKSFYTVMVQPASVSICEMGVSHRRLHHKIKADNTYPRIISEDYKK